MSTSYSGHDAFLPVELLEAVVDAVGLHDRKPGSTLKALSLTYRGLVPRCRRYIFRVVSFDHSSAWGSGFAYPRYNSSRVQAFLALLSDPQSERLGAPIAAYIQVLRIENNFSPLFFQITALLPNLKEFHLRSTTLGETGHPFLEYEAFHEATNGKCEDYNEEAIESVLKDRPPVEQIMERLSDTRQLHPLNPLHLDRLYINSNNVKFLQILSFLVQCFHLETRGYRTIDVLDWPLSPNRSSLRRAVTVRRLELHGTRVIAILQLMMGPEHIQQIFDHLEYFTFQLASGPGHANRRYFPLLTHCSSSLQGVEINLSHCTNEDALDSLEGLDLPSLLKLKHLKLVNWPRSPQQKLASLPNGITSLLSPYGTAPSVLETVYICVQRAKSPLNEPVDWTDSDGSWEGLIQLVGSDKAQRAPGFRHLVSFKVSFMLKDFVPKRMDGDAERGAADKAKRLLTLGDGIEANVVLVPA